MFLDLKRSVRVSRVVTQWALRPFHPT